MRVTLLWGRPDNHWLPFDSGRIVGMRVVAKKFSTSVRKLRLHQSDLSSTMTSQGTKQA